MLHYSQLGCATNLAVSFDLIFQNSSYGHKKAHSKDEVDSHPCDPIMCCRDIISNFIPVFRARCCLTTDNLCPGPHKTPSSVGSYLVDVNEEEDFDFKANFQEFLHEFDDEEAQANSRSPSPSPPRRLTPCLGFELEPWPTASPPLPHHGRALSSSHPLLKNCHSKSGHGD